MSVPRLRVTFVAFLCIFVACTLQTRADDHGDRKHDRSHLSGVVIDAASGVAISDALVGIVNSSKHTHTDARGSFSFEHLDPGTYRLEIRHAGYQPSLSTPITLTEHGTVRTTLDIQRANGNLSVIAVTSTQSSSALQQSSVYTATLNGESLLAGGVTRAGDALRTLAGVNNGINGDTAALGDDIDISIRGIGEPETVAAIDGHPIGYGIKGGYNYQLSPVFPFRNVQVLYGSGGSDILGVNAIGGVVNFQTLDPTPASKTTVTQGFGTFERLGSSASATGTLGRFGYAMAYGVSGVDGPFRNDTFYQPGAQATYTDDSSATSRSGLIKFSYTPDAQTNLIFTDVNSSYWENKTGNGDGDYLPYATAYARGVSLGAGNPATYAAANAGWQGAGPAWQAFNFGYQDLDVTHRAGAGTIGVDTFTTLYDDTTYRENLPTPEKAKTTLARVQSTGSVIDDDFASNDNDVAVGYSYLNNAYVYQTIAANPSYASPDTDEAAYFIRDVYQPTHSPLATFLNVWAKHASATSSSYLDPRISLLDRIGPRDVIRMAYGATTTEPTSDELDLPFSPSALALGTLQGAGGGATYVCGGLNSIGNVPSSALKPERGVDEELAYGHTWSGDSITQVQLYNVDVYNKLFSTIAPLSQTGTSGISPGYVTAANAALESVCGSNYSLGVTGTVNVGTLRASGGDISGRWRLNHRLYADYDWALTSSVLANAPAQLLQSNLTDIVGTQIKGVPLHTASVALDDTFGSIDARYTLYTVSANNTKNLPPYDYSNLQFGLPLASRGTLTLTISNLFNQWANIAGLIGEGVPAPLNSYATARSYTPLIGAAATEQFGLPYRQIYVNYRWSVR